jgi:N-acyl homoserine lactone hydrolase
MEHLGQSRFRLSKDWTDLAAECQHAERPRQPRLKIAALGGAVGVNGMWTIDAVPVGVIRQVPRDLLVLNDRSGDRLDIPLTMFVVRRGDECIIVDTGGPVDEARVTALHGWPYACTSDMRPSVALESVGVDPANVSTVVNTHLHWDHCANNDLFVNAEVIVQDAELRYAVHPCRANLSTYEVLPEIQPAWINQLHRFRTVKGWHTLAGGITLVPLPGHSPGSQGVVVDTAKGKFVITGDCLYTMHNWGTDQPGTERPSGRYTDLSAFYESLDLLKRSGWSPIPSHDLAVVQMRRYG